MSDPYMSEIRIMAFNYAPKGWQLCNGQTLAINQNQALFALLGTIYGGNGTSTFLLPNLQGTAPVHSGNGFTIGQASGQENHTLLLTEMPKHNHLMAATAATATVDPPGTTVYLGQGQSKATSTPAVNIYSTATPSRTFAPTAISNTGGSLPHPNQQPYLVLNFCICMQGIFPSRN